MGEVKESPSVIVYGSFFAGIAISIGCMAYLATGYAWLFPIGLFIVCFYKIPLFTGRVCYPLENNFWKLLVIYLLNTLAVFDVGILLRHIKPEWKQKAIIICEGKLSESLFSLLVLSMLCNMMIFVAVDTYRRTKGNPLGLIFATTIFVACGFEHCIANGFYFALAGVEILMSIRFLLANALFNMIGGILAGCLLPLARKDENNGSET